jgi:hypothetical protein
MSQRHEELRLMLELCRGWFAGHARINLAKSLRQSTAYFTHFHDDGEDRNGRLSSGVRDRRRLQRGRPYGASAPPVRVS